MSQELLLRVLMGLFLAFLPLSITELRAEEDSSGDEDGEGEDESEEDDGPDISREEVDEDDVENWSDEGEVVEKKEEKKAEEKKVEVPPEPKRYGNSGNWYEVNAECARCPTLLDQSLGIEEPLVMRQFFDHIQIASNRRSGKFVFPSEGENRPLGVLEKEDRILVWQYVIDDGSRLTDTYANLWDLKVEAKGGLLYGRRYEVQAWTDSAYEKWGERGYKADPDFIPSSKLRSYADLEPVKGLDTENNRLQVGENSRIGFVGYAAFVRSDVDVEAIAAQQESLRQAAERDAKRVRDQKEWFRKGQGFLDEKDWGEALASFLKAKELGMESLDLHYELGFAHYKVGEFDQAKTHYRTILDRDPRDTDVRYNLARIYEKEKDWEGAIREYQAILKFDPDDQVSRDRLELLKAARDMIR
ncbi:MAG: tetratricopeptide repeat protein [Myxococcota bacterium]|nr:tetratricopeptide repeat protein [Myxococcota bacterium]